MELSRQIDILNTKLSAIPFLGNGGCNHVMVKVEDYYVDGYIKVKHGDCRFFTYDYGNLSFRNLELIRTHGAWCDWYNTGNNKLMNKIIKEVIK